MIKNRRSRLACTTTAVVFLLLAGCSQTEIVYRQLDWLIPWYVDRNIDLTDTQKEDLDQRVERQLRWHREQQLSDYAKTLNEFANALGNGISRAELEKAERDAIRYWTDLTEHLLFDSVAILSQLDTAQVNSLMDAIEGKFKKDQKRAANARWDRISDRFEDWLGPLSHLQRRRLRNWAAATADSPKAWLAERAKLNAKLYDVLSQRADTEQLGNALIGLMQNPERFLDAAAGTRRAAAREQIRQLLIDIDKLLSSGQRAHLIRRIKRFASNFEALSKT